MKRDISTFLFDLDGTLLNSWPDIEHILKCTVKKYSKNSDTTHIPQIKYMNITEPLDFLKASFKTDNLLNISKEIIEYASILYHSNIGKYSSLYCNIDEILNILNNNSIPWGIVTNRSRVFTNIYIEKFSILKTNLCLVCNDDVKNSKPFPDSLNLAMNILNVKPKKCIFIGDSSSDIQAGENAGVLTLAVKYGYGFKKDTNDKCNADYCVDTPVELVNIVKTLLQLNKMHLSD